MEYGNKFEIMPLRISNEGMLIVCNNTMYPVAQFSISSLTFDNKCLAKKTITKSLV